MRQMTRGICVAVAGVGTTPGGIAAVSRNLVQAIQSLPGTDGFLEVLSFLERDTDRPNWLPQTVRFRGFEGRRLAFSAALFRRALWRRRFIFDHVTLVLPLLPLMATGWIRASVLAHGSEAWRRIRRSSRWTFRYATVVLANSEYTRERMRSHGVRGNIVACPLGLASDVNLREFPPPPAELPLLPAADGEMRRMSRRAFLLVGRMLASEREKGHDQLLMALPLVHRRYPDAQLVFVGPGDDRERLAERSRGLGVAQAVFMPGFLSREALDRIYAAAYAYTMPSWQEGFGLVYLEAMNYAKACLGCHNDGAADVIVHGETGLLLDDPGDVAKLADALLHWLGNPQETMRMGRAGFERLHAHFTAKQYQMRLLSALRDHLP
ncbi:MAG: glycosyltransferase family 4 protein [Nevskiales bacterium]